MYVAKKRPFYSNLYKKIGEKTDTTAPENLAKKAIYNNILFIP